MPFIEQLPQPRLHRSRKTWALQPISSRTAALPLVARIGTARSEVPKMFTQCRLPILTASIAASSQRHRYSVRRPDCADVYGSFPCPLWVKSGHVQCTNVKAAGLALFRDRVIAANLFLWATPYAAAWVRAGKLQ